MNKFLSIPSIPLRSKLEINGDERFSGFENRPWEMVNNCIDKQRKDKATKGFFSINDAYTPQVKTHYRVRLS